MSKCKHCGSTKLTEFTSLDKKFCHDCKGWSHWPLKAGKKPIFDGVKR